MAQRDLEAAPEDLEVAFHTLNTWNEGGQWARLYARLHPAQQTLVDEATFVACAENLG